MKDLYKQRLCLKFCFKLGKIFHEDFTDVATGLWIGLFEPYAMSGVLSAFQIGQNTFKDDLPKVLPGCLFIREDRN